jgi:hypothetical protein
MSMGADPRAGQAVRGYVDSVTTAAIDGWAFEPANPTERVVVELRLDGRTLATTVADRHRPDLVRAGIGDAFHGFRFTLRPDWAERRAELAAIAHSADGTEVPLPLFQRGAAPPPAPVAPGVAKALDQLTAGQRALEGRLAELATRITALPVPAAEPMEAEARIAALEGWVARLDERLAALQAAAPAAPPQARGLDTWQVVLLALLAVLGLGGLAALALALAL